MPDSPTIEHSDAAPRTNAPASSAAVGDHPFVVAALLRSGELEEAVKRAVADGGTRAALHTRIVAGLDQAALAALRGDIILLDVDPGNSGEMHLLAQFLGDHASIPVLVTARQLDVAGMREFLRVGVLDVVPQPFDSAELATALRQALARRPQTPTATGGQRGRVVSFIASGGGVGTTSLAVQGACALARRRKSESVCLLDFDIQFGCAVLLLDAEQRASIFDLINAPDRLDAALLRGAMARPHGRFDLLSACLLYTSPSPRDLSTARMPSSA